MNKAKLLLSLVYFTLAISLLAIITSCDGPGTIEQNIYLEDTLVVTEYDTIYQDVEVYVRDTFRVRDQPLSWQIFYGPIDPERNMFIDTIQLNYTESVFRFTVQRPLQYSGSDNFEIRIDNTRPIESRTTQDGITLFLPFIIEYGGSTINQTMEVVLRFQDILETQTESYSLTGITYILNIEYREIDTLWSAPMFFDKNSLGLEESQGILNLTRTSFSATECNTNNILQQYEISGDFAINVFPMYEQDSVYFSHKIIDTLRDSYRSTNVFEVITGTFNSVSSNDLNRNVEQLIEFTNRIFTTSYENILTEITYQHGPSRIDDMPDSFSLNMFLAKEDVEFTTFRKINFLERQDIFLRMTFTRN